MDIRTAVQECATTENTLGRPVAWGHKGQALDLAMHFFLTEVRLIVPMAAPGAAVGHDWKPTPSDLLGDWETLTLEDLRLEMLEG